MERPTGLGTEQVDNGAAELDLRSAREIVELMHTQDRVAVDAVGFELDTIAEVAELVAAAFSRGGRLVYVGAGTSGRLAESDAAEIPPTFGTDSCQIVVIRATSEDDEAAGRSAIHEAGVTSDDVVVGIAASGRTPFVVAAVDEANHLNATTVGIACNADAALTRAARLVVTVLTGPEVVAGSTRLKAGTAQKLVLNMITTAAMIRLGRTYGNRMVAMRLTNTKLHLRAATMVADIADCTEDRAELLLEVCGGDIRRAVVVERLGLDPDEARDVLDRAGGSLRQALES
jgi:N-acetylmuramic acid 6-phosphate etherase